MFRNYLCLSGVVLLAACGGNNDNDVFCEVDSKVSCGTSTVELCNESNGAVFWRVDDGHEFRCGADSSACTQTLFKHCNPHSTNVVSQSETGQPAGSIGVQLGAAWIEERKKRMALEKTINQLIIESAPKSGQ